MSELLRVWTRERERERLHEFTARSAENAKRLKTDQRRANPSSAQVRCWLGWVSTLRKVNTNDVHIRADPNVVRLPQAPFADRYHS